MTDIRNEQAEIPFGEKEDKLVRGAADCVLGRFGVPDACVSVLITNDAGIRELNRGHRGKDSATDVLSFPLLDAEEAAELAERPEDFNTPDVELGDIVISAERAAAQAKEYGHSPERELAFLTAHSMLHLLGFDHETDRDEAEMFSLQEDILKEMGLER